MLRFRLDAFRRFLSLREPRWSDNCYPPIDFQSLEREQGKKGRGEEKEREGRALDLSLSGKWSWIASSACR
ncbi:hypothetical protein COCNU_scaffold029945G000040 [Cocos nucifera]|nr:hypothetical protein [Cocos nucifera]